MDDSDYLWHQINSIQRVRVNEELNAFITEERAQKFDLLVHLATNLKQTLVVCGSNGIGKTTMLTAFKELKADSWPVIILSASERRLSFESVQEQLWWVLSEQKFEVGTQSLTQQLQQLEKLNQRLVLIIDDAGKLAPGLMTSLMQYAIMYPCLRIVFALTNEELKIKRNTDQRVGECHFIEIPPLSLSQCREYLLDLLAKPDNNFIIDGTEADNGVTVDNAINDVMVKQIYKKTQGVPGKIVKELPNFLNPNVMKGPSWIVILVFACIITVAIGALLWRSSDTEMDKNALNRETPGTSGLVVAPLNIPGQVPAEPESQSVATTPKNSVGVSKMPEASTSKPDYYTGYARVREKDALDEYQANKDGGLNQEAAPEQLKVEIIPPEPTPTLTTPAQPSPIEIVNEASKPLVAATAKTEPEVKEKFIENNKGTVESKVKPDLKKVVKLPKKDQKLPAKDFKKIEPTKRAASEVKQPVIAKHGNEEVKPAAISKSTHPAVKVQPEQVAKAEPIEKAKVTSVDTTKTEIAEAKKAEQAKVETAEPAKPVVVEKAKVISVDATKTETAEAKKPEQAKVETAEPIKPVVVEKASIATPKPNIAVAAEKPNEPVGMARLGVVMKYKPDAVKPSKVQPNAQEPLLNKSEVVKPNLKKSKELIKSDLPTVVNAKFVNENVESVSPKSSGGAYTLQVMVFSQQQTLQSFMSRHKALGSNLRYVTSAKDGGEKYVVSYGSFNSKAEANVAKRKLPADFGQAYARKR